MILCIRHCGRIIILLGNKCGIPVLRDRFHVLSKLSLLFSAQQVRVILDPDHIAGFSILINI